MPPGAGFQGRVQIWFTPTRGSSRSCRGQWAAALTGSPAFSLGFGRLRKGARSTEHRQRQRPCSRASSVEERSTPCLSPLRCLLFILNPYHSLEQDPSICPTKGLDIPQDSLQTSSTDFMEARRRDSSSVDVLVFHTTGCGLTKKLPDDNSEDLNVEPTITLQGTEGTGACGSLRTSVSASGSEPKV